MLLYHAWLPWSEIETLSLDSFDSIHPTVRSTLFFERVLLLPSSRIYVVTGMSSSHASTFSTNFSCQFFSVAFKKCTQGSCVVTLPLSTPPNPLDSCYDRPSTDTRQFWQFFGDSTSSVLVREKLRHDNETSLLRPSVPNFRSNIAPLHSLHPTSPGRTWHSFPYWAYASPNGWSPRQRRSFPKINCQELEHILFISIFVHF